MALKVRYVSLEPALPADSSPAARAADVGEEWSRQLWGKSTPISSFALCICMRQ